MTPQEKANELVSKFDLPTGLMTVERKQCALIVVDEILKLHHPNIIVHSSFENNTMSDMTQDFYWQKVKSEIEKL
jgi:hypothetical protein